jgi:hypothetical protein
MDMNEWLGSQARGFREEQNPLGLRMMECYLRAYEARESDPDLAFSSYTEGKHIAGQLGDPWWVLFYESHRIEALLHFKRDYRNVLDMVVQCVADLRKPTNAAYPGRWSVWDNLIAAYLGIDPVGYEAELRQAMDYLDKEIPAEPESSRYLLLARKRIFEVECDRPREAYEACMRELDLCASDKEQSQAIHFAVFTYCSLCAIAALARDWDTLASWSSTAEELARIKGHHCELSEALAWQAVAAHQQGDKEKAHKAYLNASTHMSRLKMPPKRGYYDALSTYHLHRGDLPAALAVRDGELKMVAGWGRLLYETRVHVQRAWLLAGMGQLQEGDLATARAAAGKLRKPESYLKEIDEIAAGPGAAGSEG